MSITRILNVESIRFGAPDLGVMRQFLLDFGLRDAEDAGDGVLRMRGTGDAPFIHETEQGDAGLRHVTLRVADRTDLEALAESEGVTVESASGPGGGERVILTDPNGYRVEVVAGKARASAVSGIVPQAWNVGDKRDRERVAKRLVPAPAHVRRLGHVVLAVADMAATWAWWESRFGLLVSDEVHAPNGDVAAMFVRCNCGDEPVDHHALNFASIPGMPAKFHHAAFEVADLDDLIIGNEFLAGRNYQHDWGIGRHILGSQVFDYWKDPFGHRVEHWTDGDYFDASEPPNVTDIATMLGHQWGPAAPENFVA